MKLAKQIFNVLNESYTMLEQITNEEAQHQVADGKWSKIQILGHLVDSAQVNLGRFVRLQQVADLQIESYDQEHWVFAQGYQQCKWDDVFNLFQILNRQLARVVALIPPAVLEVPRPDHNLRPPFYTELPESGVPTLAFLIEDYICHMEHHLRQILPEYAPLYLDF